LIHLLGSQPRVEVLNFLYRLKPDLKERAVSRAVRRAIYRLEQAGVKADEGVLDKGASLLQPRESRPAQGFLTAYELLNIRFGLLALPAQTIGINCASFVASHSQGLESFEFIDLTGAGFRRHLKNLISQEADTLIEVPPGQVRFVLAEAAARTIDLGRVLPQEYEKFIPLAGVVPLPDRPLIYELIEAEHLKDKVNLRTTAARLLDHKFLNGFFLGEELKPYFKKLDEIEESVLVLSEHQKAERRQAVYEQAEREIFGPEKRAVLKRCLEVTALLLWQAEEKNLAEGALALALALDSNIQAGAQRRFDFIQSLVRDSFDRILSQAPKTDTVEDRFERSESGLILPAGIKS